MTGPLPGITVVTQHTPACSLGSQAGLACQRRTDQDSCSDDHRNRHRADACHARRSPGTCAERPRLRPAGGLAAGLPGREPTALTLDAGRLIGDPTPHRLTCTPVTAFQRPGCVTGTPGPDDGPSHTGATGTEPTGLRVCGPFIPGRRDLSIPSGGRRRARQPAAAARNGARSSRSAGYGRCACHRSPRHPRRARPRRATSVGVVMKLSSELTAAWSGPPWPRRPVGQQRRAAEFQEVKSAHRTR
jgi:hypothetical protein